MTRPARYLLPFACAISARAQTLPELFQKAKAQVKGEAWQDALKTLELSTPKPRNPATSRLASSSPDRTRSTAVCVRPTSTR